MPEIGERWRPAEEEYFRRKEAELIEKLRKKAEEEASRKGLAEAVGLENRQILELLMEMGFDRATVVLLFLVPLLEVAWSDGAISGEERRLILEAAHSHGIEEGTPAHARLGEWLAARPPSALFERAIAVIRDIVSYQSDKAWRASGLRLVDACERIAAASGGILGLGSKISAEERAVLRRVTSMIEKAHAKAAAELSNTLRG
ncbi:MAG: hypothetical protein HXY20_07790 [Acidobacteria bacterium]|nr:hypothetical protein [Acidobacteriota bacterium]